MRTFCLAFHAGYRCRHTGRCCSAPWDIEVETDIVQAVDVRHVIRLQAGLQPFARPQGGRPQLQRTADGDCHFHHDSRCALQVAGGESLLPSACRHFPRVILRDARGILLTLSHYCPTAAALLLDGGAIEIVEASPPLALGEPVDGLDGREALPPLLRPGMLMDLPSYEQWERRAIETIARTRPAGAALERIAAATERIRRWSPGSGDLVDCVQDAFDRERRSSGQTTGVSAGFRIAHALTGPHPSMEVPDDLSRRWQMIAETPLVSEAVARYVAAATFGNWMAYRGQGLRTTVEWLRACYDIVRLQMVRIEKNAGDLRTQDIIEAVGAADYLAVHTIDSLGFGRAAVALEHEGFCR